MRSAVTQQIIRSVRVSIQHAQDKSLFLRIRDKRNNGEYKRVICLEQYLRADGCDASQQQIQEYNILPSRCASLCCTSTEVSLEDKRGLNNIWWDDYERGIVSHAPAINRPDVEQKRKRAEEWVYEPDYTPIPQIEEAIENYYRRNGWRVYSSTIRKLTAFINHLCGCGGAVRVSIQGLKKMGFSNDRQREHIKRLEKAGIISIGGYCAAEGLSREYKLTKSAMSIFDRREAKSKRA